MSEEELKEMKIKLLFDGDSGLIRGGLKSMKAYAQILYAQDEDELDDIINSIVDDEGEDEVEIVED